MLWRPPYIAYRTFLKFFPAPLSIVSNLNPPPQLLFLMPCFFDWIGERARFDVLFHLILWIYKCRILVLSTRTTLLCVLHTYTQRYTARSGTNRLTHPYKYILKTPVVCTQQLSVLHWIIHWYQKFTFRNAFSFKKLFISISCIPNH